MEISVKDESLATLGMECQPTGCRVAIPQCFPAGRLTWMKLAEAVRRRAEESPVRERRLEKVRSRQKTVSCLPSLCLGMYCVMLIFRSFKEAWKTCRV